MLKNILTIICALFITNNILAQSCTPDNAITTNGYYPAELDSAQENSFYSMTMQVYSLRDTMVDNPFGGGQVNAAIDSIIVKEVSGMPSGVNYVCNPANCRFVTLKTHCINLYGTPPSGSAGVYPLVITVDVKARIGGTFPVTQEEEITGFNIVVNDDSISTISNVIRKTAFSVYPNPSNSDFNIKTTYFGEGFFKVFNSLGQEVYEFKTKGDEQYIIPANTWNDGVYILRFTNRHGEVISQTLLKQ